LDKTTIDYNYRHLNHNHHYHHHYCRRHIIAAAASFSSSSSSRTTSSSTSTAVPTTTTTTVPPPLGIPYSKLSIGIPKEIYDKERRVAVTPESTVRFLKANFKAVYIEENAGMASQFSNIQYEQAGATIIPNVWTTNADIFLKVRKSVGVI
jgi:NAD(P) transhydrogenase